MRNNVNIKTNNVQVFKLQPKMERKAFFYKLICRITDLYSYSLRLKHCNSVSNHHVYT